MSGELVLVIEDNPKNLKLVRDVLEADGYRTLAAGTGEEGLALAAGNTPDLILMDVQLPGMDGVTALRRLRERRETSGIPVMVLTALAMKDDRQRFLAAGFDGYLEKPIDLPQFRHHVRTLLATMPDASAP